MVPEDSIGVKRLTKKGLAAEKPAMISWDNYLQILRKSVDPKVLRKNMNKLLDEVEKLSYDQAIARVEEIRAGKSKGYTLSEAKERVKMFQLAKQLEELSQLVRAGGTKDEVNEAARSLDHKLHEVLPTV